MRNTSEQKIPKVLHYCWFGTEPLPQDVIQCLNSWKKQMPDYAIVEWNTNNFDVNICAYTRQAFEAGKYAFVSDYARLYILYHQGGVYLDSDVEALKSLDALLVNEAFTGFESRYLLAPWIMGSIKGHPMIKHFLDYYEGRYFIKDNGLGDLTPNTVPITEMCRQQGLILNNAPQNIKGLRIYPETYFCPWKPYENGTCFTENTYTNHHFAGGWFSEKQKKMRSSPLWKVASTIGKIALRLLGIRRYMKLKEIMKI
jgi:mannosyltransferase OCH1-like enzyme